MNYYFSNFYYFFQSPSLGSRIAHSNGDFYTAEFCQCHRSHRDVNYSFFNFSKIMACL